MSTVPNGLESVDEPLLVMVADPVGAMTAIRLDHLASTFREKGINVAFFMRNGAEALRSRTVGELVAECAKASLPKMEQAKDGAHKPYWERYRKRNWR